MLLSSNSTDSLLNSFPMFGHPGISALEYAGQVDKMREQSMRVSEVSFKRKSTTASAHDELTTPPTTAGAVPENVEVLPPVHLIDEFGCQHRRKGTFINHTPRNFEVRSSKPVDVYRPSRVESENYSRPLSRQSSMASGSPAVSSRHGRSPSISSATFGKSSTVNHNTMTELDSSISREESNQRSTSAPPGKTLTCHPDATNSTSHHSRAPSVRSTSLSEHQSQEPKRQRRQTPFKVLTSTQISVLRHAPLEPWVAEHRRKGTNETIGDVPFDMDREVLAEMGTFGVIQRYFDSQGGGPVTQNTSPPEIPLPVSPESNLRRPNVEPIAIYPIDELGFPDGAPPVPDRSPKRLTNPAFPLHIRSKMSTDSDFKVATEGAYSPYHKDGDLHIPKKRAQACLRVGQARAASANGGRLAPTILGHDAQVASSDLRLNELSYFLKHTGPSPEPSAATKQRRKKKGMGLFKVKQGKSLVARVGSVESSPQRAHIRPVVPTCAREMTTSGGAKHLKIIIPTDTPRTSQAVGVPASKQRAQHHSRHISIAFTEEVLNPLASPDVERMISTLDTRERSSSTPAPKSPRSPKRSPRAPQPVVVNDHPLASRDEQTRARKLRDLQRIKRKPVPTRTPSEQQQDSTAGALSTPAHTPEPTNNNFCCDEEGMTGENAVVEMHRLQSRVVSLQRQNTQLTEALAKIVGLELRDGDTKSEDVLVAAEQMGG